MQGEAKNKKRKRARPPQQPEPRDDGSARRRQTGIIMVMVALLGLAGMWWLGEVRPKQRHAERFDSPTEVALDDLVAEYQRDAVAAHTKWKDKAIHFTAPTMGHSSDSNMKLAARSGSADCWFMESEEGEGAHLYAPGQRATITAVVRDWDGNWQTLSLMCRLH